MGHKMGQLKTPGLHPDKCSQRPLGAGLRGIQKEAQIFIYIKAAAIFLLRVNLNRMRPRCHSNKLKMQSDLREDRGGILEVG